MTADSSSAVPAPAPAPAAVPGNPARSHDVPSASTAPPASATPPAPRSSAASADTDHWRPGTQVLWRYRENGARYRDRVHIARPVTVVRDDAEVLAVWMAPGTRCVRPVLADGTAVHHEPLATRYRKPRSTRVEQWWGSGVLKLAHPGEPWSVWLFWLPGWRFKNWYVNLEEPRLRWSGGVDSVDHFLDLTVDPDGSWDWRDEDEFAQAQADGLVDAALAARVREAGARAVRVIEEWGSPFCDGWQDWRPDPAWPVPMLPADWDRPAV